MNIFLPVLVDKLRQLTSIQCFHIERAGYISGIELFPARYQPGKTVLDPAKAYVCEYRDLRLQEPRLELPPLICVIEPGISVDDVIFRNRLAITVSGHTVSEVLVMLSQLLYDYGCSSSELTDLSRTLLRCKNIQELIDVGYQALQNPIIVTDGEQRIVAFTDPHIISASSYHKLVQLEHLPVGRPNDSSDRAWGNNVFILPASEGVVQPEGLGMALSVKSKIVGYLNVMAFNHPCTEHDTHVMEMLGNLLTIELLQRPHIYSLSSDMKWEHFFREILDNTAGDVNNILAEQQALNLKLGPCLC
ncbi:MAG: hypothetical protein LUH07_07785, partial [Lachnospiraceae bacterium]|nr:hypothetical protein [Lachnospiraceae bacterium]